MEEKKAFRFKTSKWKSFLFFLLIATIFWALTKVGKAYSAPVTSKIEYVNLPKNTALADENIDRVTFNLFANGYDFLTYKLKKPTIQVDVSRYYNANTKMATLDSEQLIKELNRQFPSERTINNTSLESLTIGLNAIVIKKIPVIVKKDITLKRGYKILGGVKVKPDSIEISGPSTSMDSISKVFTETIVLKDVESDKRQEVSIVLPNTPLISVKRNTVVVEMIVKEFTQRKVIVPIKVINVPSNIRLKLIPENVTLIINVPVDDYNTISKNDFVVECDYNNRNKEENFMVPHLVKTSMHNETVEIETDKIDFLTLKK